MQLLASHHKPRMQAEGGAGPSRLLGSWNVRVIDPHDEHSPAADFGARQDRRRALSPAELVRWSNRTPSSTSSAARPDLNANMINNARETLAKDPHITPKCGHGSTLGLFGAVRRLFMLRGVQLSNLS